MLFEVASAATIWHVVTTNTRAAMPRKPLRCATLVDVQRSYKMD
ncbi:hypothetical protein ETAA8_08390 [Anatilimnocola aggregata]|uniref:Uncharacterized protein n=1 Tax=Anatilimnocola aggregata TaxID=2528021 RepID=A0A517Y6A7_9BACT|nr:hypothetical protein ETAA8_08390 [Anatilimnocola aggregata]